MDKRAQRNSSRSFKSCAATSLAAAIPHLDPIRILSRRALQPEAALRASPIGTSLAILREEPQCSHPCHRLAGGTPILAIDLYERAYRLDFGANAATYVETFVEATRWDCASTCSEGLRMKA
jgi:superoxide dismutase